ncbi:MAG: AraC family transcriptional regulator [Acidimicrobiales bacterium]
MAQRPSSSYRELAPPVALAPYVARLWVHELGIGDLVYQQPVLPDGCIDVVSVGDRSPLLAGPATGPATLELVPGTVTVGVRFRTGAAPALVGASAAEVRDQDVPLDELWGRSGALLTERTAETTTATERLRTLVDALVTRLGDAGTIDPVGTGIARLMHDRPGRSLHQLATEVGLSDRQLRRRVEAAVGYPPRMLARVLRFQRFLHAARSSVRGRDLAGLAAEIGYADQAHLTRESRELAGLPPAALLDWEAQRLGEPSHRDGRIVQDLVGAAVGP